MKYWFELDAVRDPAQQDAEQPTSGGAQESTSAATKTPPTTLSRMYHVRRSCLPQLGLTTRERNGSLANQDPLATLVMRSRELEHERFAYDEALRLLEELQLQIEQMGASS